MPVELDQRPRERFFVQVSRGRRHAHLHLLGVDARQWHERLAFRDALRSDPELVTSYAALKADLAERHRDDREAYTRAKAGFVRQVLTAQ